jgi:hypothetical protein
MHSPFYKLVVVHAFASSLLVLTIAVFLALHLWTQADRLPYRYMRALRIRADKLGGC